MTVITATALSAFCDEYLSADEFNDYCPNGLQVDADTPITSISAIARKE